MVKLASVGVAEPERQVMLFDEEPVRKSTRLLEDMSIQEIKDRIEDLKGEIASCEAAIVKKEATRKAADAAFFKS
jgi:uncharacterized small protein (DUF1192 family)